MAVLVKNRLWKSHLSTGLACELSIFGVFLREYCSLGELGHIGFLALLVVGQAYNMFMTIGEDAFGEDYVLKFCGGTHSEVKESGESASSQFLYDKSQFLYSIFI